MRTKTIALVALLFGSLYTARAETFDAGGIDWKLWGYRPHVWRMNFDFAALRGSWAEVAGVDIEVPGSVQKALLDAGLVEDWNTGLNSSRMEWIENRHWLVAGRLPDHWLAGNPERVVLECRGLDYKGIVMINGREAGKFDNAFVPWEFDMTPHLQERDNTVAFVFECPPQALGQIGWTSQITDWKPRFNYGWDWVPRIVQTGIWDKVLVSVGSGKQPALERLRIIAGADGLSVSAHPNTLAAKCKVTVELTGQDGKKVLNATFPAVDLISTKTWNKLPVRRWYPNGLGAQPLYEMRLTLTDGNGEVVQRVERRLGFRDLEWLPCKGAPAGAEPWICSVNDRTFFIQGINWTPIRPNFADLREEEYRLRLNAYKEMGVNTIRVWGGGFPEYDWLYDLCDEMGILIWQDFPLSSSGLDNYPPEGAQEVHTVTQIVKHYVSRLHHRPSLMLWCAGNELYERGDTAPVTDRHPMIASMKEAVLSIDPSRKFVPGSPSGPSIYADYSTYGKGINWDVHGPWNLPYTAEDQTMQAVRDFWRAGDAMMHSEVGVPGAMSAGMMERYRGGFDILPASVDNPLWRNVNWWVQWDEYLAVGGDPASLTAYVEWSQQRQAEGLAIAVGMSKERFPACGGFIIWMGHDCFPCMVNTSILDFEGNPKPVAAELTKIFKKP